MPSIGHHLHRLFQSNARRERRTYNRQYCCIINYLVTREGARLRKYSGTLDHPKNSDKQGATINAFQYFVYLYSKKTLVLADIQGALNSQLLNSSRSITLSIASESHSRLSQKAVLFDLMSHTANRCVQCNW
ncbi:hypothetical protein R3P38DRAFT_2590987 [Favolaschia claudopus]|uniref:Alpha-type protein kinase domain-containing protein n=1 Tax=Favolaschia claudopus TaxID=2862362 RepID=A0AAV9YZE2_9AGAR